MEFKDIKQDKRNYRIHDDRNKDLIKKSIDECGLGRSIVIDNDNEIIGGNGIVSQLPENTPIKVIETKGDELVVVKRVDLSSEDEKRKKLAIMDNSTSDSSKFDIELLKTDFDVPVLQELGIPAFDTCNVDIDSFFNENDEEKDKKKKTVKCPHCGEEFEI